MYQYRDIDAEAWRSGAQNSPPRPSGRSSLRFRRSAPSRARTEGRHGTRSKACRSCRPASRAAVCPRQCCSLATDSALGVSGRDAAERRPASAIDGLASGRRRGPIAASAPSQPTTYPPLIEFNLEFSVAVEC